MSSTEEWNDERLRVFGEFQDLLDKAYSKGWNDAKRFEDKAIQEAYQCGYNKGRGEGTAYFLQGPLKYRIVDNEEVSLWLPRKGEWVPAASEAKDIRSDSIRIQNPETDYRYLTNGWINWRVRDDILECENEPGDWVPETEYTLDELVQSPYIKATTEPETTK
jgi:hypothetical protein